MMRRPRYTKEQERQREEKRRELARERTKAWRENLRINGEPETGQIAMALLTAYLQMTVAERIPCTPLTERFMKVLREKHCDEALTLKRMKKLRRTICAAAYLC